MSFIPASPKPSPLMMTPIPEKKESPPEKKSWIDKIVSIYRNIVYTCTCGKLVDRQIKQLCQTKAELNTLDQSDPTKRSMIRATTKKIQEECLRLESTLSSKGYFPAKRSDQILQLHAVEEESQDLVTRINRPIQEALEKIQKDLYQTTNSQKYPSVMSFKAFTDYWSGYQTKVNQIAQQLQEVDLIPDLSEVQSAIEIKEGITDRITLVEAEIRISEQIDGDRKLINELRAKLMDDPAADSASIHLVLSAAISRCRAASKKIDNELKGALTKAELDDLKIWLTRTEKELNSLETENLKKANQTLNAAEKLNGEQVIAKVQNVRSPLLPFSEQDREELKPHLKHRLKPLQEIIDDRSIEMAKMEKFEQTDEFFQLPPLDKEMHFLSKEIEKVNMWLHVKLQNRNIETGDVDNFSMNATELTEYKDKLKPLQEKFDSIEKRFFDTAFLSNIGKKPPDRIPDNIDEMAEPDESFNRLSSLRESFENDAKFIEQNSNLNTKNR